MPPSVPLSPPSTAANDASGVRFSLWASRVQGRGIVIEALELDGALEIACAEGATLRVHSLAVTNDGWQFDELSSAVQASAACPELLRMRGYTLRKRGQRRIAVSRPGAYEVVDGVLRRLPTGGGAHGAGGGGGARGGAGGDGGVGGGGAAGGGWSAVGEPLQGPLPPPPRAVWSTRNLDVGPRSAICLPLVLPEPSVAAVDIRPSTSGLVLTLLGDGGDGGRRAVLPPATLPAVAAGANAFHSPIELSVDGSGVYSMEVQTMGG